MRGLVPPADSDGQCSRRHTWSFHTQLSFAFHLGEMEEGGLSGEFTRALVMLEVWGTHNEVIINSDPASVSLSLGGEGTVVGRQWLVFGKGSSDSLGHCASCFKTFSTCGFLS